MKIRFDYIIVICKSNKQYHELDYFIIKCILSLVRRGSKPQAYYVDMIIDKEMYALIIEYMEIKNTKEISVYLVDEI